jgi:transmembrane sensor
VGAIGTLIGIILLYGGAPQRLQRRTHLYTTRPGQQALLTLSDSTQVLLASNTILRVDDFTARSRTVTLDRGEASFVVPRAPGTPFLVHSGAVTTRVLGTEFLVRHNAGKRHVQVSVADGKVVVTHLARHDTGVVLTAGHMSDITDSTTQITAVDDIAPGAQWVPGRLLLRDTPVATMLEVVSRWYGYQFRYADQALAKKIVTVAISTRSPAEALATIQQLLVVQFTIVGDTVTLSPRPAGTFHHVPQTRAYDMWLPTRGTGR